MYICVYDIYVIHELILIKKVNFNIIYAVMIAACLPLHVMNVVS